MAFLRTVRSARARIDTVDVTNQQARPTIPSRWHGYEFVESRVHRLVVHHLGVGPETLVGDVTLRDDLAADSLDLLELVLAIEGEFAITVGDSVVDEVRTYGDLVDATVLLVRAGREASPPLPPMWTRAWAHIVGPAKEATGSPEPTSW